MAVLQLTYSLMLISHKFWMTEKRIPHREVLKLEILEQKSSLVQVRTRQFETQWNSNSIKSELNLALILQSDSVEISWFLHHSDFTWNQFWGLYKFKICHFCSFHGSEFQFLVKIQPSKSARIHKRQDSEPQNMLKWLTLHFYNPNNWFYVKSEW